MENKKILFLGGLHRSGTTILYECIKSHPKISGFHGTDSPKNEGQHLQDIYPPDSECGGPGIFGMNPKSYLDENSQIAKKENAEKIFNQWANHWDLRKPILAEKSPPNLVRSRFLQAMFPNSYFVFLIRHPIAVSYATKKWTDLLRDLKYMVNGKLENSVAKIAYKIRHKIPTFDLPLILLIRNWWLCHKRYSEDKNKIKRYVTIKYEKLVKNPMREIGKICKMMGIRPTVECDNIKSGKNKKYLEKWEQLRREGNCLKKAYHNLIINKFEGKVNKLGYSLT